MKIVAFRVSIDILVVVIWHQGPMARSDEEICDPGSQLTRQLPDMVLVVSRDQLTKLEATSSSQGFEYSVIYAEKD